MSKEEYLKQADYTQPDWITDTSVFFLVKNGFGHYWPKYAAKATANDAWCCVCLRDTGPLKTLKGAIKAVEATRARWTRR
jgi:hypothetical protein